MSLRTFVTLVVIVLATPAMAHTGVGPTQSFSAGFTHPLGGLDHLAAMVAVGLWAGLAGGNRIWIWPAAFVVAMLAGGWLGSAGVMLPMVEPTIAASVVVLGILAAIALKIPAWLGAVLVGVFAIAHGHAHGAEAGGASLFPYAAGFALATALLHAAGITLVLLGQRVTGEIPGRVLGAATALVGVLMLVR